MVYKKVAQMSNSEIFKEIKMIVDRALASFFDKEGNSLVIETDANERSITHKLAEHLNIAVQSSFFKGFDVDCEYNRVGKGAELVTKRLQLKDLCRTYPNYAKPEDIKGTTVYPDIIIHQRGESGLGIHSSNLLVAEVKKSSNRSSSSRGFDHCKIEQYVKQINYQVGLFIDIGESVGTTRLEWFISGKWSEPLQNKD